MSSWAERIIIPMPRRSRLAAWAQRVAVFAALLLAVSGLSHRFGFLQTQAFLVVLCGVAALAFLALVLVSAAWHGVWVKGRRGGFDMVKATLLSLLVLAPFGWAGMLAATQPMLIDITTDPDDPPTLAGERRAAAFGEEAKGLQAQAYPAIGGHRYPVAVDRMAEIVGQMMEERGWDKATVSEGTQEIALRTVARTTILGFCSDVAVRITDEGETSFVDMRSRSRIGRTDLGDNAARIESFLAELDTRAVASAAPVPTSPAAASPATPD